MLLPGPECSCSFIGMAFLSICTAEKILRRISRRKKNKSEKEAAERESCGKQNSPDFL